MTQTATIQDQPSKAPQNSLDWEQCMTPLVFRSHRARPVWVSKAHTTPPDVPSGSHCSQAPRQGNVSISFPALWATSSHWPLANLFFWATRSPDRVFARAPETGNYLGTWELSSQHWWPLSFLSLFTEDILCPSCCCLLQAHP